MTGFINPIYHIFDYNKMVTNNEFVLRHSLPYSDYKDLSQNELDELINDNEPLIFSHTMQNLLGGQLQAGLVITDFFEDSWKGQPLDRFTKLFMATLAIKL